MSENVITDVDVFEKFHVALGGDLHRNTAAIHPVLADVNVAQTADQLSAAGNKKLRLQHNDCVGGIDRIVLLVCGETCIFKGDQGDIKAVTVYVNIRRGETLAVTVIHSVLNAVRVVFAMVVTTVQTALAYQVSNDDLASKALDVVSLAVMHIATAYGDVPHTGVENRADVLRDVDGDGRRNGFV